VTWTDTRVETLTSLWGDGLSASRIAARLGDTTRNAIIGKVHRLALTSRKTVVTQRPMRPPLPTATRPKRAPSPPPAGRSRKSRTKPPRPPEPLPLGPAPPIPVTVLTLTPANCNWPEGDPKASGFHFCGRDKPPDRPYCAHHAARAYR
jgi:GcrA cell cycle regulator